MTNDQPSPLTVQRTAGGTEYAAQQDDALSYLAMVSEDYRSAAGAGAAAGSPGGERRLPEDRDLPPAVARLVEQARAVYPASRLTLLKYRRTLNDAVTAEVDDGGPLPAADALVVISSSTSSTMRGFHELVVDMVIAAWDGGGPAGDPTI